MICKACGKYTSGKPIDLKRECRPPADGVLRGQSRANVDRFDSGKPPGSLKRWPSERVGASCKRPRGSDSNPGASEPPFEGPRASRASDPPSPFRLNSSDESGLEPDPDLSGSSDSEL